MKTLFIGNSHLAALKSAFVEFNVTDFHADFITRSMGKGGVSGIDIENGLINISDLKINGFKIFQNLSNNNLETLELKSYDLIIIVGFECSLVDYRNFSTKFLEALSKEMCGSGTNKFSKLIGAIRKNNNIPIRILEKPVSTINKRLLSIEDYNNSIEYYNKYFLNKYNVRIIPQNSDTFINGVTRTSSEFQANNNDYTHMNSSFGFLQLTTINEELK